MHRLVMASTFASLVTTLAACTAQAPSAPPVVLAPSPDPALQALERQIAQFAPTDLTSDISSLPASERDALAHLVRAAQVMDALFLEQVWAGNEAMFLALSGTETRLGKAMLRYFVINKGPWSRLDHNKPFVAGAPEKPASANYYPVNATKQDVEKWLTSLPAAEKARATGFFTTIRRGPDGRFVAVPYSTEYQGELAIAATHLRAAAQATSQPTLKAFLESRAAAFASNDYYDSDVKWMELDASIEPTIGPYEVYEDEWFNYKAAFEAFITIKDAGESAKLQQLTSSLQDIENNLPLDPKYRNPTLGTLAPIAVVNTVFSAGDGNRGVQTAAFNLPNDERVIKEKGSKRVMLKNNQQAKFDKVLVPISRVALAPADQGNIAFDAFFTHILMHELMHGLGPHNITVGGRATTVRQELKDTYSTIEEAKADISGLFALHFLIDKGALDKGLEKTIYTTFLASAFRSIRFGITEAHGRGQAIQMNYLLDHGAFTAGANGTFAVDGSKIRQGVIDLTRELLTLEAEGNYAKAKQLIETLGVIHPNTKAVLDKLSGVPVDIAPRFVTANDLVK
ncbi:MAG: dipeptidyl-peptidase 3 family protein [Vicinamibacterales bacterium]